LARPEPGFFRLTTGPRIYDHVSSNYLDSNSCSVFPGSAGVSPAQQAARMAALPGYKLQEHHGIQMMSGYLGDFAKKRYQITLVQLGES
jgi:hypothetical protein